MPHFNSEIFRQEYEVSRMFLRVLVSSASFSLPVSQILVGSNKIRFEGAGGGGGGQVVGSEFELASGPLPPELSVGRQG